MFANLLKENSRYEESLKATIAPAAKESLTHRLYPAKLNSISIVSLETGISGETQVDGNSGTHCLLALPVVSLPWVGEFANSVNC